MRKKTGADMASSNTKTQGQPKTPSARHGLGFGSAKRSPAKELVEQGDEILDSLSKRHNPGIIRLIRTIADRE